MESKSFNFDKEQNTSTSNDNGASVIESPKNISLYYIHKHLHLMKKIYKNGIIELQIY